MKQAAHTRQQPALDPAIAKLLKQTGLKYPVITSTAQLDDGSEEVTGIKARGWNGQMQLRSGHGGAVVAIAQVDHYRIAQDRPERDENGNLVSSHVTTDPNTNAEIEQFPSDIDSAAVTLTRNLHEDACMRFLKRRGCSMRGGNMLLEIQRLWRAMLPAMGVVRLEFTSGGGDADHAKAKAIDAATRLNLLAARTTKKRWAYITDMALHGLHPEDIARKHKIRGGPVRVTLKAALDDVAR